MTAAQQKIIAELTSHEAYIVPDEFESWNDKKGPLVIEVGFGMGHSLHQMAMQNPHENYLGIDVYTPGVASLLKLLSSHPLPNLNVICADAIEIVASARPASIDRIQCYFPDPWRKKRHRKRRLFTTSFPSHVAQALKDDGYWHLITDWMDYADDLVATLRPHWSVTNKASMIKRPATKYESRGLEKGHQIYEFEIRLIR